MEFGRFIFNVYILFVENMNLDYYEACDDTDW